MVGLNKMMIIGNVGTDPELRYTPKGNPVTSFRMATGRSYTASDGEKRQETEWFTIVCWNQLAELCNSFLTKGRRAYVEGRLHSHTWDGPDGQQRFRNEIIANQVLFLDRQGPVASTDGETDGGVGIEAGPSGPEISLDVEELPF